MNTTETNTTQPLAQIIPFEPPTANSQSPLRANRTRTACVWVDPNGLMHIPGQQTHEEWAEAHLRQGNTLVNFHQTTAADVLFDKGWRLMRFEQDQLVVTGGILTRRQDEELLRFATVLSKTMVIGTGDHTTHLYIPRIPNGANPSPRLKHP